VEDKWRKIELVIKYMLEALINNVSRRKVRKNFNKMLEQDKLPFIFRIILIHTLKKELKNNRELSISWLSLLAQEVTSRSMLTSKV
jgi:hypothetical protein